jgi:hypothetical protein
VPPLVAAFAPARPVLRPSLASAVLLLAIAVGAGFSYVAPAYTEDAPLRRHARALQDGDGPAVWEVGSIEPGLDLAEGAPGGWTRVRDAPPVSVPAGALPHPFVFRATGPSLGAAPIAIAAVTAEPVAAGTELAVTVVPRRPGLAITFILPPGVEPARASLPGLQRRDRWTATYVAPPAEGIVFRASFGKIAPPALRELRIAAMVQGGGDWPPPSWLAPQRTAWTVDATWIVAPFALPIAPVPPLR